MLGMYYVEREANSLSNNDILQFTGGMELYLNMLSVHTDQRLVFCNINVCGKQTL
jgi:hypothetical protein